MKTLLIIIGLMAIFGGVLYAQGKLTKADGGFTLFSGKIKTYYANRIVWGDIYTDHKNGKGAHNTEVVVWGDGWEFSTTTDDDGNFKVEVKPDSPFKIKASDGNVWSIFEGTLDGVPLGTTKNDKTEAQ